MPATSDAVVLADDHVRARAAVQPGRVHGRGRQRAGTRLRQAPHPAHAVQHHDPRSGPGAEHLPEQVRRRAQPARSAAGRGPLRQPADPAVRGGLVYVEPVYVQIAAAAGQEPYPILQPGPGGASAARSARPHAQGRAGAGLRRRATGPAGRDAQQRERSPAEDNQPHAEVATAIDEAQTGLRRGPDGPADQPAATGRAYGRLSSELEEALENAEGHSRPSSAHRHRPAPSATALGDARADAVGDADAAASPWSRRGRQRPVRFASTAEPGSL